MTGHRITARRGYDREELNSDNRRKVMDAWKRFESSRPGVWLSRHTDLLERLSDEESHLVARVGAMVCVFALILSMVLFLAVQGDMLAWTLLTLPVFAVAFMVVMALWIFWDAYRDSGERAADWLSTRPGVATWRQLAADYGRVPSTVTWSRPSCRACWPTSATGNTRHPSPPLACRMVCGQVVEHGGMAGFRTAHLRAGSYPFRQDRQRRHPRRGRGPRFRARDLHARGHHQNDALPA